MILLILLHLLDARTMILVEHYLNSFFCVMLITLWLADLLFPEILDIHNVVLDQNE